MSPATPAASKAMSPGSICRFTAGHHDPGTDPGEHVAGEHPERRQEPVAPVPRVPEDGHVRKPDVHGQVAEPGEEDDVPQVELILPRARRRRSRPWSAEPPTGCPRLACTPRAGRSATAPAMNIANIQGEQTSANWLSFSKPRMASTKKDHARWQIVSSTHPKLFGSTSVKRRRRDPEGQPDGGRGDRDHRAGQDAVQDRVGDVVDRGEPGPGDLPDVPVDRQTRAGRDRRADEGPREHREQVPDQQAEQQIARVHAVQHEERADHELGARDVFPGEQPGELASTASAGRVPPARGRTRTACPSATRSRKTWASVASQGRTQTTFHGLEYKADRITRVSPADERCARSK